MKLSLGLDLNAVVGVSDYVPYTPIYSDGILHYDPRNVTENFVGGLILSDNSVFDMTIIYQDNFATEYLGPDTGITDPTELFDMTIIYQDNFATEFVD